MSACLGYSVDYNAVLQTLKWIHLSVTVISYSQPGPSGTASTTPLNNSLLLTLSSIDFLKNESVQMVTENVDCIGKKQGNYVKLLNVSLSQ